MRSKHSSLRRRAIHPRTTFAKFIGVAITLVGAEDNLVQFARMISAVDAHACGEPGRVIVGGVLDVPGGYHVRKNEVS